MLSGSLASAHFGEARSTNDVDLVIDPSEEQLRSFVSRLGGNVYVSRQGAGEALRERGMFNVVDLETGWKADLIIRKSRPFSQIELGRRRPVPALGAVVSMVSPEDSILSKLEWAKEGGSARQRRDALGVAIVQRDVLDRDYLRRWAVELGVSESLEEVLAAADEVAPR